MAHGIVKIETNANALGRASPCATVLAACGETPVRLGHRIRMEAHEIRQLTWVGCPAVEGNILLTGPAARPALGDGPTRSIPIFDRWDFAAARHDGQGPAERDMARGRFRRELARHGAWRRALIRFGGARHVTVSASGTIRLWNATTGALDSESGAGVDARKIAISLDGRIVAASAGRCVIAWDASDWRVLRRLDGLPGEVTQIALDRRGRRLAFGYARVVEVQDMDDARGAPPSYLTHVAPMAYLNISHDGRFAYAADVAGGAVVWDLSNPENVPTSTIQGVQSFGNSPLAIQPDGRFLAIASTDGSVRCWDLVHGGCAATLRVFVDGGWLWSTPPDEVAVSGWFFGDAKRIDVCEIDAEGNVVRKVEDPERRSAYLAAHGSDATMVFGRMSEGRRAYKEGLQKRRALQAREDEIRRAELGGGVRGLLPGPQVSPSP